MSDLWDFGSDEPDTLSDSSAEVQEASDTDFLVLNNKRRKLQRSFLDTPDPHQSDGKNARIVELLSSPAECEGAGLLQEQLPVPQPAHRAVLDAKTSNLLQQLKATQDAMKQAVAEVDLTQEDGDEESVEPSPVQQRYGSSWSSKQRGGGAQLGGSIEDDEDIEIMEETIPDAAGAHDLAISKPAATDDKINLKLQSEKGVKMLKMRKTDPFQKMFDAYKKFILEQGWIASLEANVKFIFDGDILTPDDTPAAQDLEGDEMIEVRFPR